MREPPGNPGSPPVPPPCLPTLGHHTSSPRGCSSPGKALAEVVGDPRPSNLAKSWKGNETEELQWLFWGQCWQLEVGERDSFLCFKERECKCMSVCVCVCVPAWASKLMKQVLPVNDARSSSSSQASGPHISAPRDRGIGRKAELPVFLKFR